MADKFRRISNDLARLVERKQRQYGDSATRSEEILRVLYPSGVRPKDYPGLLLLVRVLDKLSRVAEGCQGDENPWRDIAGYAMLALAREEATDSAETFEEEAEPATSDAWYRPGDDIF